MLFVPLLLLLMPHKFAVLVKRCLLINTPQQDRPVASASRTTCSSSLMVPFLTSPPFLDVVDYER
ncbi:hypothetical protein ACMYLP_23265, partial [Salmonella enterica subsp. enterica serovar Enteritidis]|uniref:hypothetical protein n=1 Tax=Salmonella enterica TaxID=28901 RepID=UPI0039EB9D58